MKYPTRDLIFLDLHTRIKARVYSENQLTRGIFHRMPLQTIEELQVVCNRLLSTVLVFSLLIPNFSGQPHMFICLYYMAAIVRAL